MEQGKENEREQEQEKKKKKKDVGEWKSGGEKEEEQKEMEGKRLTMAKDYRKELKTKKLSFPAIILFYFTPFMFEFYTHVDIFSPSFNEIHPNLFNFLLCFSFSFYYLLSSGRIVFDIFFYFYSYLSIYSLVLLTIFL